MQRWLILGRDNRTIVTIDDAKGEVCTAMDTQLDAEKMSDDDV